MRIDWWTLALQAVNAIVLIWLLSWVLFKPIAEAVAARKAAAQRLLDEADSAKRSALEAQAEVQARLAAIDAEHSRVLAAAMTEGQKQKDDLIASARAEAEALRSKARAEIDRERKSALHSQMTAAAKLAVRIAERLIERFPQTLRVSAFIDGLAQGAAAAPPDVRADFDRDGPIRLKAPRALTPIEQDDCRHALQAAFGRPVAFEVEIDPSLMAGLELESRHTSIRNSLRADIAAIAEELEKHDANDAL